MRIAQIVLPSASAYERKAQRIDAAEFEIVELAEAQVAHVYAGAQITPQDVEHIRIPYVSSAPLRESRWTFRKAQSPAMIIAAAGTSAVPEAVESRYFEPVSRRPNEQKTIGSFHRAGTRNMVDQTLIRIHRFRSDVAWLTFDHEPSPEDLAGVDVWVDPTGDSADLDGFVAEALVIGIPVVTGRTPINAMRLEQGRTGWLVPPLDPNEMTHAILAALFKPEVAENKLAAARQTASKFRARQRKRVLASLYEQLIP
jgi:hypothetical protein